MVPRHAPGQVPEYIMQRKEKQRLRAMEEAQEHARRALVPEGFRLVPDDERASAEKATRELWQESMSNFVKMPPHDGVLFSCSPVACLLAAESWISTQRPARRRCRHAFCLTIWWQPHQGKCGGGRSWNNASRRLKSTFGSFRKTAAAPSWYALPV
jgi:hypothetical protein